MHKYRYIYINILFIYIYISDKPFYTHVYIYIYTHLFKSRAGRCGSALFFTVFQHYNRSFVKVNEDVLMATREKILLEEVSTPP